jgi:hypothetical protein
MLGFTADLFLLPEHDVGVVVLTNAGAANSFRGAVRRGFLEIVFEGRPLARENLTLSIDRVQKALAEELKLIAPADEAWIGPLLGAYDNPSLGRLELRRKPKTEDAYELDAGEWKTDVARKTDRDGTVTIVTTLPPYVGFELVPRTVGGQTVLVLDAGQQVYTFTPAAAP